MRLRKVITSSGNPTFFQEMEIIVAIVRQYKTKTTNRFTKQISGSCNLFLQKEKL
jgi:hypothetical protein